VRSLTRLESALEKLVKMFFGDKVRMREKMDAPFDWLNYYCSLPSARKAIKLSKELKARFVPTPSPTPLTDACSPLRISFSLCITSPVVCIAIPLVSSRRLNCVNRQRKPEKIKAPNENFTTPMLQKSTHKMMVAKAAKDLERSFCLKSKACCAVGELLLFGWFKLWLLSSALARRLIPQKI
jgi:hypothetical protein